MQHNFAESLATSQAQADASWWEPVYRKAFPCFETMASVRDDGWAQRGGIDRVVLLSSGKTLTIDEKVRAEDWPDILLEYWSSYEHKRPGWVAKDLACDFIAYAFIPSQTCYLLPFQTLRTAWRSHCHAWVRDHRTVRAKNQGYTTLSVAVPTDVLLGAMADSMRIEWGAV